ncbi:MAG: hypothetical protein M3Y82_03890, partial [Verrucomicrobiota bacterium]|nr:hypothetical protein [Verrucomicrobiota bacterium]
MKKLLLIGTALVIGVGAFAQGTIVYNNRVVGSIVAPVFGPEVGSPTLAKTGNTAAGFPVGTQTYTGAPLD